MMRVPENFRELHFIGQVAALGEVAAARDAGALPDLRALAQAPTGDDSVDLMVRNILRLVLAANEAEALAGLRDPVAVCRAAARAACLESRFERAGPILAEQAARAADDPAADTAELFDVARVLARLGGDEAQPVLRRLIRHADPLVAALALRELGERRDPEAAAACMEIVAEVAEEGTDAPVPVWEAGLALGRIGTPEAAAFLAERLAHPHPVLRRVAAEALVDMGRAGQDAPADRAARAAALHALDARFARGGEDDRILAATVLGRIGDKGGASILAAHFDRKHVLSPNIRQAMLEALGRIGSLTAIICLADQLREPDELCLLTAVQGLERFSGVGVARTAAGIAAADPEQGRRIAKAAVAAGAVRLLAHFAALPELAGFVAEAGGAQGSGEEAGMGGAGSRMLAVDDSATMRLLYRQVARRLGLEAVVARDGEEGLRLAREASPAFDLVLADVNMPRMDGLTLLARLRELPAYAGVPMVVATTEGRESQRELARRARADAYVVKPFVPESLAATLAGLLSRRGGEGGAPDQDPKASSAE